MPRTLTVTVPGAERAGIVARILEADGVASVAVQPGASVCPEGDVVTVQGTTAAIDGIIRGLADENGLARFSFSVAEPSAMAAPKTWEAVEHESNEGLVEDMGALLRRDTNVSINYLGLMAMAGIVAAAGLLSGALHIVIGAMLIAPGFEPPVRAVYGAVFGSLEEVGEGLAALGAGYAALAAGAALTVGVAALVSPGSLSGLADKDLVAYWTTPSWNAPLIALAAAIGGAIVVTTRRTVFGAGVMVALALVPGAAIAGMGLATGSRGLALDGLLRFLLDIVCVVAAAFVVLGAKRAFVHRRPTTARPKARRRA